MNVAWSGRGVCKTPLGFGFGRFAYPGCATLSLGVERLRCSGWIWKSSSAAIYLW
jgi:hypothetical protein